MKYLKCKKRKSCLISIAVILCFYMTGCNQIPQNKPTENSEDFYYVAENNEDIVLNFAVMGEDPVLKQAADKFNNADNGYCIKFIEYPQLDYGEINSGQIKLSDFELVQDIINTDNIDIISSYSFQNEDNYKLLQKKGAFLDLYSLMENDREINLETLNSHVLSLNEFQGELYSLPTLYCIYTMGGEPQYVGNKLNWTFDEMIQYWNKMPENATIHGKRTKEEAFYTLIAPNLVSFIDYENGKTYFDSPEFKKCLEFCNSFEYGEQGKTEYDFDAPQFVTTLTINSFMSMWSYELGSSSPKLTLVGFPSSNGKGAFLRSCGYCFSISSKSSVEKQKGAWEFIRTFVTKEEQLKIGLSSDGESNKTENGFCINNDAFETIKNDVVDREYAEDIYIDKGEEYETVFPSKEDCEILSEYINTIDRWEVSINDSIDMLISEEIMSYFAGEISVDECIDNIKNRTSIWISEQF